MALFSAAIRRDSVSLLRFPFCIIIIIIIIILLTWGFFTPVSAVDFSLESE